MKIYVDIQNSRMETDNPKILSVFSNRYSFKVPGYQYVPAYRNGHWDGTKKFFKSNGAFATGMLSRILEDCKKINCAPEVIYKYEKAKSPSLQDIDGFNYFDYQKEAIEFCLQNHRVLLKSPTGSGKTLISAGLIKSLAPRKMVFLFREKGILKQTYEFLKKCGIENLGICFGEGFIYGDIMLSTVQSVEKILDTHLNEAEVLLVDEVHQFCKGDLTTAAINSFPKAQFRFGFTATPPTEEISAYNLESAFGQTYTTRSTQDLIADGKLAKATIQIMPFRPKLEDADNDLPYQQIYEKFIVNNEQRNKMVVDLVETIKTAVPDAKILILVKNLDHLTILKKQIPEALTLEGADDLSERYKVVSKFIKAKKASVLIGTTVLQTGIDIKAITHMINARSLQGEIPTIQGMGRALRTSGNKEAFIYDFMDFVPYLEGHSKQRIKHYEAEGHKVEKL